MISDLKALKENSVEFFLSRIWLFDVLKRTQKIIPKRLLNKGMKNLDLTSDWRLSAFEQLGQGQLILNLLCFNLFSPREVKLLSYLLECSLIAFILFWKNWCRFVLLAAFFRYSCNRYDEKDAQAARDAQAVSFYRKT